MENLREKGLSGNGVKVRLIPRETKALQQRARRLKSDFEAGKKIVLPQRPDIPFV